MTTIKIELSMADFLNVIQNTDEFEGKTLEFNIIQRN